ncbi:MAG: hypothetical protein JW983_09030 [Elusimicrobia bacterium]|nr:hypothetical protein [Elusimicrobiota bacterium]
MFKKMANKRSKSLMVGILVKTVLLFTIYSLMSVTGYADAPGRINFQGRLTDSSNNPLTGTYSIRFSIWDTGPGTGGTELWNETQGSVSVENGIFNVLLGDVTPLTAGLFTGATEWLEIKVGADTAMTPRVRIVSSGYAFNADTLDGYNYDSFVSTKNSGAVEITAADVNVLTLTKTGTGIGCALRVVSSGTWDGAYFESSGTSSSVKVYRANTAGSAPSLSIDHQSNGNAFEISNVGNAHGISLQQSASGFGIQVINTGTSWDGIYVNQQVNSNGIQINKDGAGPNNGLKITNAGTGASIYVDEDGAGTPDNLEIRTAGTPNFVVDNSGNLKCIKVYPSSGTTTQSVHYMYYDADKNESIAFSSNVYVYGSFTSEGPKSFVQAHPTDSTKEIYYVSLEGGECGTYTRGTAQLENGIAVVKLPEHFAFVTEEENITAVVTPLDNCNGFWVSRKTPYEIEVRELNGGTSNARFDYLVQGIRAGYKNFPVVRSKNVQ